MAPRGEHPATGRGRVTAVLAWGLLALGLMFSVVAAVVWRQTVTGQDRNVFHGGVESARTVVATEVQRSSDLLAQLTGVVIADPTLDNRQFLTWYDAAQVPERFPGGIGVSYIERVSAADLASFAALQETDPVTGLDTSADFQVFPDAPRPYYCLQRLGVWETADLEGFVVPEGFDFCAEEYPVLGPSSLPETLDRATTTGSAVVVSPDDLSPGLMAVFAAVYDGGVDPGTPEGREAALQGWVAASFAADSVIAPVVAAAPGTEVTLWYEAPAGRTVLASDGVAGDGPVHTDMVAVTDGSPWVLEVSGVVSSGLSPTVQAGLVLLGGIVVSVLAFLLVWTLAGSRRRALDMVEEKTEELEYQALHDALTGLPNRALLLDRAAQMVSRQARAGGTVAALFVDLDNFKAINDTLGHAAGDQYLVAVANRLQGILRDADTVGRLGGDEFLVLAENPPHDGGAAMIAERILGVLAEPVELDGATTPVSCSVGVATGVYLSADVLIQDADLAMYQAKADGKGRVVVFEPAMQQAAQDRTVMEWELAGALERGELHLAYQPTFDLRTGVTTGVEALLRWQHPVRGLVSPAEFIPIAEASNLIVPIGRWVLRTACCQAAEWVAGGLTLRMAVNLSARQLDDEGLIDDVAAALADSGLPAELLVLEITETTLMRDTPRTQHRLRELKALGVGLAIDDFGTGYSSMAYLQQFDVDTIKIDRAFVTGLAGDEAGRALLHTLVQLGKSLQLETLAEGIEDREQLDELVKEDCDTGQGFLYARPMPAEEVERFLAGHLGPSLEPPRGLRG